MSSGCASISSGCIRSMKLVRLPLPYSVDELTEAIIDLLRANEAREDTYIFPLGFTANSFTHRYDLPDQESSLLIHARPMPSHLGSGLTYRCQSELVAAHLAKM